MNRMLQLIIPIILLQLLMGCAEHTKQPGKIILKHPVTFDFQSCGTNEWKSKEATTKINSCVKKYEALGYEVWGER